MKQKIILIGGAAGTGKTTVAREAANRYNIHHRIGTGFIREIVKTETKNERLDSHTYLLTTQQAYNHLADQTNTILESINACINRAGKEGTSLIIEGSHILPWIIKNKHITHSLILYIEDEEIHRVMLDGISHKERIITNDDFRRIREMQYSIVHLAEINGVPLIKSGMDEEYIMDGVKRVILR